MYMKKIFLILALVVVLFFTTNQVSAVTLSCTDSDGGKIYSTQGNLSYAGKSYTDYCYTTNTNYVIEYYCNESGVGKAEYYLCNIGCENGACNSTTCTPNYNNCGSWSACTNGSKIQTCSQTNCPSLPSTKTNTESCTATCTPNYNNCGSWSACTNGSKTQTCSQTNCPSLPSTQTNTESCTATCTPNYNNCGSWSACTNGSKTQTCSQTNCPSLPSTQTNTESCTATCTPNYNSCTAWSSCTNGSKTQTCTQTNCPLLTPIQTNTESCTTTCTPNYTNCTAWSACINGSKTQTCTQTNCPSLPSTKTNTESCTTSTACTDSDGGKIYSTQGVLSYGNKSYTDYCYANTNYVIEYYCNESDVGKAEYYLCNGGCENGACKTNSTNPGTCTDTDGGEIYSIRGTTSKDGSSSTDFCSGNTLTEYYCGPNGILTALATCDGGCNAGVCVTTCTPNYNNCGSWSACTNGSKTQTCSQTNCPSLPSTKTNTESCTATCTPNYNNCGSWSACTNGSKTQTCSQTNCPT